MFSYIVNNQKGECGRFWRTSTVVTLLIFAVSALPIVLYTGEYMRKQAEEGEAGGSLVQPLHSDEDA
jgi:hypothetical protein